MIDALTLLETRRSVSPRSMTFPGPNSAEIDRMLRIAARVPDHGKLAPWRFVRYEGEARAAVGAGLAAILEARGAEAERIDFARNAFACVPLVVGILSRAAPHPKIPEWEQILSAGAACMNLCHAAHAMGYAANWLTDWWAFDAEAARFLGAREGERFAGFIHIGTPTETPMERPRPALADVAARWSVP